MITCSICTDTTELKSVQGLTPQMPTGWSQIMISEWGKAIRNFVLCVPCTTAVRDLMTRRSEHYRDHGELPKPEPIAKRNDAG